jgi:excinuclease UvrABC helicase subunit UvrB
MKLSGVLLLASTIISSLLIIFGGYITIDNFVNPSGNLFEGIMMTSIGLIMAIVLLIANSIGKTIMLFQEIFTNQVEFQQKMAEFFRENSNPEPRSIGDIIKSMGSVTVTNLNTGETSTTNLGEANGISDFSKLILKSMINGAMNKAADKKNNILDNMTREQLEDELAKAVSSDDFERAMEIRNQLKKLDNPQEDNNENNE